MKKDIGKILASGSAKQRIKLFAENAARERYGAEPILSKQEAKDLYDSFKTPSEARLYNRWSDLDRSVTMAISNLQGYRNEVLMYLSDLKGYILVWDTLQGTEELANYILSQIKDPAKRQIISHKAANNATLLLSKTEEDEEGYLKIDINAPREIGQNLYEVMILTRDRAIRIARKVKAWERAILDAMDENGIVIKTYVDLVRQIVGAMERPVINWPKYAKKKEKDDKRYNGLLSKYELSPDLVDLEPDPDEYDTIYNAFFND
jgi:hypothetical protein